MPTREQIKKRFPSFSGLNLKQELMVEGVGFERIYQAGRLANIDFDNVFCIAYADNPLTGKKVGVYTEIDGNQATKANFYLGLKALARREPYDLQQSNLGNN